MAYPRRIISTPNSVTITSAGLPSWVPSPGKFSYASTGTPQTDIPPGEQYPAGGTFGGTQGWNAIWIAWDGSCFIPTVGALGSLFFFGGGHYAYYGNEIIAYDIAARTFNTFRPRSPHCVTVANGTSIPNDNTYLRHTPLGNFIGADAAGIWEPVPFHTYNSPTYVPVAAGGAAPLGSYFIQMMESTGAKILPPNIWVLDLNTKLWNHVVDNEAIPGNPSWISVLHFASCYDTNRKVIWTAAGEDRKMWRVNLKNGTCAIARGTYDNYVGSSISEAATCYIPPPYDIHFGAAQSTTQPSYWGIDLSLSPTDTSPLNTMTRHQITLANPQNDPWYSATGTNQEPHSNYAWINDAIYVLMPADPPYGTGAPVLHKLTPPAAANWKTQPWTWTKETLTPQNGTETSQLGGSIYSRWQYIPALKCILYSIDVTKRVVAARHSSWI